MEKRIKIIIGSIAGALVLGFILWLIFRNTSTPAETHPSELTTAPTTTATLPEFPNVAVETGGAAAITGLTLRSLTGVYNDSNGVMVWDINTSGEANLIKSDAATPTGVVYWKLSVEGDHYKIQHTQNPSVVIWGKLSTDGSKINLYGVGQTTPFASWKKALSSSSQF